MDIIGGAIGGNNVDIIDGAIGDSNMDTLHGVTGDDKAGVSRAFEEKDPLLPDFRELVGDSDEKNVDAE